MTSAIPARPVDDRRAPANTTDPMTPEQHAQALAAVKNQTWFYEFDLPDGTTTTSYLAEHARDVHGTRARALRAFLGAGRREGQTALDVACHEGYFSLLLASHFDRVVGVDKNPRSLEKARLILDLLGAGRVQTRQSALEDLDASQAADFVLSFGLLYHVDDPVRVLRQLGALAKRELCIETQVLPFDVTASVEDGSFLWQRDIKGLFGVCRDYAHSQEGGMSDLALVPSLGALEFLLREVGFRSVQRFVPAEGDYEQFRRGHRVILLATK